VTAFCGERLRLSSKAFGPPIREIRQSNRNIGQYFGRAFHAPDVSVCRIRFPELVEGFETARQAWDECGCAARSAIPVYAQARETRRRLKIAAAFFEPNSITLEAENTTKK